MRNAHLCQYRASQSVKFKALIYFLTDSVVLVTLGELRLATIASLLSFILNEREKTPLFSSPLPSPPPNVLLHGHHRVCEIEVVQIVPDSGI